MTPADDVKEETSDEEEETDEDEEDMGSNEVESSEAEESSSEEPEPTPKKSKKKKKPKKAPSPEPAPEPIIPTLAGPKGSTNSPPQTQQADVLDLLGGPSGPSTPSPAPQPKDPNDFLSDILNTQPAKTSPAQTDNIMDLFTSATSSVGGSPSGPKAATADNPFQTTITASTENPFASSPTDNPFQDTTPKQPPLPPGAVKISSKHGLTIAFEYKPGASSDVLFITAHFFNANPYPLQNLDFKVAVPKYMNLKIKNASATTVPPNFQQPVTQRFALKNNDGSKRMMLKTRTAFIANGQSVVEEDSVNNLSAGSSS